GRSVDAAAPRRTLAVVLLAAAGPDDSRVAVEDRERAERAVRLLAEDVLPGEPLVRGFPDAARRRSDVQNRRILRVDLEVGNASAGGGGADVAEVERVERRARPLRLRQRGRDRDQDGCDKGERAAHGAQR